MSGELDKERSKLISVLKKSHDFEPLVARNDIPSHLSPLEDSINKVNECDIYVGLLKYKYGTKYNEEENPNKLSYTHREFREAEKIKFPQVFIYNGKYKLLRRFVKNKVEKKREEQLLKLIKEIRSNHITAPFFGKKYLADKVIEGLRALVTSEFKNNLKKQKNITRNEILGKTYFKRTIGEFDDE